MALTKFRIWSCGSKKGIGSTLGRSIQLFVGVGAFAFGASFTPWPSLLQQVRNTDTLVLATTNSPTTYYLGAYGPSGPDYELGKALATDLGVRLKVRLYPTGQQALEAVQQGQADIAAPGVSVSPKDFPQLHFTPPYQLVSRVVVYRRGEPIPSDIKALNGDGFRITVAPEYSHLMKRLGNRYPALEWRVRDKAGTDELLVDVASGKVRYTIANTNEFKLNRRFYPSLKAAFTLGQRQPLAWAVRGTQDHSLYQATTAYFARAQYSQLISKTLKKYYRRIEADAPLNTSLFMATLGNRLPQYAASVNSASAQTGLPWQLLVAIGYQESHWNPNATSPTGVRGLMMLTRPTAACLGIHNRLNPHLSILGGARYLTMLLHRLPSSIPYPNRLWMALAAYNMGFGHLLDARQLVKTRGGNPNSWSAVKGVLPLLNQRRYFIHTHFGYANGAQAAQYVTSIRNYYDVLMWRTAQNSLPRRVRDRIASSAKAIPAIY